MKAKRQARVAAIPVIGIAALVLAGCTQQELHGYLPGFVENEAPATNHTAMVSELWVGSWVAALVVGVVTWGLMLWAMVVYRRRRGQTGLPVQLRYNMPIEIFFTTVPLIMVLGLFAFTTRDQMAIEAEHEDPDVTITAIAKQWAWDFQYDGDQPDNSDAVWTMGVQAQPAANGDIDQDALPKLVLPVDQKVTINLTSRDVIHSFWIIDFLYKKDMYPGTDNSWSFIPTREGTYDGKCAELCGEYHSMMLFTVDVVSQAEYDAYLAELAARGQTGDITTAYDRLGNSPGTEAPEGEGH